MRKLHYKEGKTLQCMILPAFREFNKKPSLHSTRLIFAPKTLLTNKLSYANRMIVSALTFCTTSRVYSFSFLENKQGSKLNQQKSSQMRRHVVHVVILLVPQINQESGYKYSWLLRTNKITRKIKPGVRN